MVREEERAMLLFKVIGIPLSVLAIALAVILVTPREAVEAAASEIAPVPVAGKLFSELVLPIHRGWTSVKALAEGRIGPDGGSH
jgi:hypothetical protein